MTNTSNQSASQETASPPVSRSLGIVGDIQVILGNHLGLILPVGLLMLLTIMLVPIPTWLMDVCLAFSLAFSIVVLISVVMMRNFDDFSVFPTVLLLATLIRLALNVASTRLILTDGHLGTDAAGQIIQAFGNVIVGGNYVIGLIIFLVLVIINFVVITRGSGRIAEVTARFTLDALPGKQMAIDADLSSGLIDEDQARGRRKSLDEQSSFFGAMDGASKFVRGDAIAGLLITFINIIAGIIVGSLKGMTIREAAFNYTILTVGDGLVTQIPSLLISVSAGMLVTKSSAEKSIDTQIASQLTLTPYTWILAAATMLVLAIVPGMPALPFIALAAVSGLIAWFVINKSRREQQDEAAVRLAEQQESKQAEKPLSESLQMDVMRLELGYGLLPLVNAASSDNQLPNQIKGLRRQFAEEFGFILPAIRIQDNLQLPSNTYIMRLKEIEVGRGKLITNMIMVMDPSGAEITDIPGEATTEPIFGLRARWIAENMQEEAHFRGYTVVKPATIITTHLAEIMKDHMDEILTYAEVRKLLEQLPEVERKLIDDLVPNRISYSFIQQILKGLLAERVSIRDLTTVIESISEATAQSSNITFVIEHVRSRIARQICNSLLNNDGVLELALLSPRWEQIFQEAIVGDGEARQFVMSPSHIQEFMRASRDFFEDAAKRGQLPAVMVLPSLRPYVRGLFERFRSQTVVLSQNEIHPKTRIESIGVIN